MIRIEVPGEPVPQGRPRFSGRGGFVRSYDPPKSKEYKKHVKEEVQQQYHGKPLEGQLLVELSVYRPIQKSISKKERDMRLLGFHRPIVKGDIDNYFKAVTDACTGLLWVDDAQIVSTKTNKYYSENPHVEMLVIPYEFE
ncbi:RusA family crossover junction endodeoxyribonuclease [Pediococcus acidilactici]|uniref:RusA family crossover junction endodeoxyribonuclease n=1 Tax=Pediococcus acidilactici TaxID=1254 RepID=UPI003F1F25CE